MSRAGGSKKEEAKYRKEVSQIKTLSKEISERLDHFETSEWKFFPFSSRFPYYIYEGCCIEISFKVESERVLFTSNTTEWSLAVRKAQNDKM